MEEIQKRNLIDIALQQRERSYAPYSGFLVGAALLTADNIVYSGCNIENAAYTPTNCAERTAFFKAVSEGARTFQAIAIAGGIQEIPTDYCSPCGVCLQVMMEFCDPDTFLIIMAQSSTNYLTRTLRELLPMGFGPKNLSNS